MASRDLSQGMGGLNQSKNDSFQAPLSQSAHVDNEYKKEQKKKTVIKIVLALALAVGLIVLIIVLTSSNDEKVDPTKPDQPGPQIDPVDPQPIGPVDPVGPDEPLDPSVQYLEATQMIEAFQAEPDFSSYKFQARNEKFTQSWKSPKFGGPVTNPVKKQKLNEQTEELEELEVKNNLLQDMKKVKVMKDTRNGFFNLKQVKDSTEDNFYWDMQIQVFDLTDSGYDVFVRLEYESSESTPKKDGGPFFEKDVQPILNGFGRLIYYSVTGADEEGDLDPSKVDENVLERVLEGEFVKGKLNGFGRIIYEKEIIVGFFVDNKLYGKGIIYPNDEKKPDLLPTEGLFDKSNTVVEKIEVNDFILNKLPKEKEEKKFLQ